MDEIAIVFVTLWTFQDWIRQKRYVREASIPMKLRVRPARQGFLTKEESSRSKSWRRTMLAK
jgi:hypothetical protein